MNPTRTAAFVCLTLASGCSIDSGKSVYCDRDLVVTGTVDGVRTSSDDYSMQSVWFNTSIEEEAVSDLDRELMENMGLDPDDDEDVSRYVYFTQNYDHRVLLMEELSTTDLGSLGGTIGKDLGTFFFDLEEEATQPETWVKVFDASPIEAPRDAGNLSALGDAIRDVIDEMRSNGQPDVLVAFSPDRSDETVAESSLIVLLSNTARYARSGQARFHEVISLTGDPVESIDYPTDDIDAMSLDSSVVFDDGDDADTVDVQATCLKVSVSGAAD